MIRWLLGHVCPHCIQDEAPLSEHPAIRAMEQTNSRLDWLLEQITAPRKEDDGSPLPIPPRRDYWGDEHR